MRACIVALCVIALTACSARHEEVELSNVVPALQPPHEIELSNVAPAPQPPQPDELGNEVRAPQTPQVAELGNEAQALQLTDDASPISTPSNAYAERAPPRNYVRMNGYWPGTIVVKTRERRLYYVLNDGRALRYPVGVGRAGQRWTGSSYINSKRIKPPWSPPDVVKRDNPSLPDVIPGGSPSNPMGEAALLIAGGEYAIHGTNRPNTVGHFVSYGCIRMYNEDIMDLFQRAHVGTKVVVEP